MLIKHIIITYKIIIIKTYKISIVNYYWDYVYVRQTLNMQRKSYKDERETKKEGIPKYDNIQYREM